MIRSCAVRAHTRTLRDRLNTDAHRALVSDDDVLGRLCAADLARELARWEEELGEKMGQK